MDLLNFFFQKECTYCDIKSNEVKWKIIEYVQDKSEFKNTNTTRLCFKGYLCNKCYERITKNTNDN